MPYSIISETKWSLKLFLKPKLKPKFFNWIRPLLVLVVAFVVAAGSSIGGLAGGFGSDSEVEIEIK